MPQFLHSIHLSRGHIFFSWGFALPPPPSPPLTSLDCCHFRFRQTLPVDYIQRELGFDPAESADVEAWTKFVTPFALKFADPGPNTKLDCKASMESLASIE